MPVIFIGTEGNDNFTGTGVGQIFGLEGNDTLTSALNANAPGSELFGNTDGDYLESEGIGDTARGGQGDDYLINTSGKAWLFGDLGDDTIYGEEGQYTLFGGAGSDYISAQEEQNLIFGDLRDDFSIRPDGSDTVPGNDTIVGLEGEDTILGGGGDDSIIAGPNGESQLFGNIGNDSLFAAGNSDSLQGGQGNDYVLAAGSGNNLNNIYAAGNLGKDTVYYGGAGNNGIFGGDIEFGTSEGNNSDYLFVAGGAGHQIFGNLDDDTLIYGGAGSDVASVSVFGGQGNDAILATGGAKGLFVSGDKGQDYLDIAASNSTLIGGGGTWSDTINVSMGDGNMLMGASGSDASDDFLMVGSGAGNTLAGGQGNDYLMSGGGSNVLDGAAGDDTYIFGAGDTIVEDKEGKNSYFGVKGAKAVEITLQSGDVVLPGASGQFTFSGDDSQVAFIGTGGAITGASADLVSVQSAESKTSTGGGNDTIDIGVLAGGTIDAGDGNDFLNVGGTMNTGNINLGSGNDTVEADVFNSGSVLGGAGDDVFNVDTLGGDDGMGKAVITGGAGSNTFNVGTALQSSIVGGDEVDSFNIQAIGSDASISAGGGDEKIVIGTLISDGMVNDSFDASVDGGDGNDTISVGLGMSAMAGGVTGTGASVFLSGGAGNDLLAGHQLGGDSISGGDGDDQLFGGFGQGTGALGFPVGLTGSDQANIGFYDGDSLTGGAGADIFVIENLNQTGSIQASLSKFADIGSTLANEIFTTTPGLVVGAGGAGFTTGFGSTSATDGRINAAANVDTLTDFSAEDRIAIDTSIVNAGLQVMGGTIADAKFISYEGGSLVGAFETGAGNNNFFGKEFGGKDDLLANRFYFQENTGGLYYADDADNAFLVAVLQNNGQAASLKASQILITDINTTGGVATDIVIL